MEVDVSLALKSFWQVVSSLNTLLLHVEEQVHLI